MREGAGGERSRVREVADGRDGAERGDGAAGEAVCAGGAALVGEIAPGIVRFAIPAIPGLAAVKMVRNSSRNSKFAIPGTWGAPNGAL